MMLRITTLSENTSINRNLLSEWGLSVFLETEESNILFDCGQTTSVIHNAAVLNIDLTRINRIVLSHGHYDHTGGLRDVLQKIGGKVEIIAHPDIWQLKYARGTGEPDRYIGIPFQKSDLVSLGANFKLDTSSVQVANNVITTGEIPMVNTFEDVDTVFWVNEKPKWNPDLIMDDLALIIKTRLGLVVILGCGHRGIINTLYRAQQITGSDRIYMVLGGSHLIGASEERLWHTIAELKKLDIQRLGLCHCTGVIAAGLFAREFGSKFFLNGAGTVVEIS